MGNEGETVRGKRVCGSGADFTRKVFAHLRSLYSVILNRKDE
jgi:hypothetical protein